MRLIRISLFPPRCWIAGHRIHHFWVGVLLILHDRNDRRVWLRDLLAYDRTKDPRWQP